VVNYIHDGDFYYGVVDYWGGVYVVYELPARKAIHGRRANLLRIYEFLKIKKSQFCFGKQKLRQ